MTYSYDSQNRLVSVYQGSTEIAEYTYDSAGRRHSKTLASSGATTTYLYDADSPANVLVEYQNGTWVRAFVYGPGTDQPLCMLTNPALAGIEPDGTIYYYHQDALGSVIALSDSTGALVERYSYDVFGKPEQASSVGNPYMFTGRRYDTESGLYYYRARMYHPGLGRFLQTDPIGYEDGVNWYAYCGNGPISFYDPQGLDPYRPGWVDPVNTVVGWLPGDGWIWWHPHPHRRRSRHNFSWGDAAKSIPGSLAPDVVTLPTDTAAVVAEGGKVIIGLDKQCKQYYELFPNAKPLYPLLPGLGKGIIGGHRKDPNIPNTPK